MDDYILGNVYVKAGDRYTLNSITYSFQYPTGIVLELGLLNLQTLSVEFESADLFESNFDPLIESGQVWQDTVQGNEIEVEKISHQGAILVINCTWGGVERNIQLSDFIHLIDIGQIMFRNGVTSKSPTKKVEYGENCSSCGQFNNYAVKNSGYTCWSCRNGV